MSSAKPHGGRPGLSIVIASYNSAPWLPTTLASLVNALAVSDWDAEIVVVDDGSTDDTTAVLDAFASTCPVTLNVVRQDNMGRFLARWEGASAARNEQLLLLDSRLLVHPQSLAYLQRTLESAPQPRVWNGHVDTDPAAALVGHFWSVPTHVFWGDYLGNPRPMDITPDNFDRLPKGTGFLFLPKALFLEACRVAWPADNAKLVSDDTKLLRFIAGEGPIRLDPGFSATYRPRTTVRQFLAHAYERGTLFVDSYAGTSAMRNVILVALGVMPPVVIVGFVLLIAFGLIPLALILVALGVVAVAAPAIAAAARRCPARAVISYFTYVIPFGCVFWAGLIRGLRLHSNNFAPVSVRQEGQKQ